jgi:hypothetical protein
MARFLAGTDGRGKEGAGGFLARIVFGQSMDGRAQIGADFKRARIRASRRPRRSAALPPSSAKRNPV